MSEWFYVKDGEQAGPVSESELKTMLASKTIEPDTYVWKEGMADWAPATDVRELAGAEVQAGTSAPATDPSPEAVATPAAASSPASDDKADAKRRKPGAAAIAELVTKAAESKEPAASVEVDPADAKENMGFAILAYLGILWLVPFLVKKDSKFVFFHLNQGLTLLIFLLGFGVGMSLLMFILDTSTRFLPLLELLAFGLSLLAIPVFLVLFVLAVVGILNVVQGVAKPLPVIGKFTLLKS